MATPSDNRHPINPPDFCACCHSGAHAKRASPESRDAYSEFVALDSGFGPSGRPGMTLGYGFSTILPRLLRASIISCARRASANGRVAAIAGLIVPLAKNFTARSMASRRGSSMWS
jgi:hypothetical protein